MTTDMKAFNATFPHLAADPYANAALEADIGRRVRYRIPTDKEERKAFLRSYGTVALEEFEIVGVQRCFDGRLAYRVKCLAYEDRFGRPMDPALAVFEEQPK